MAIMCSDIHVLRKRPEVKRKVSEPITGVVRPERVSKMFQIKVMRHSSKISEICTEWIEGYHQVFWL